MTRGKKLAVVRVWVLLCICGITLSAKAAPINVAVLNTLHPHIGNNLQSGGMNVTTLSVGDVQSGNLTTGSYDTFLMGRIYAGSVSSSFVNGVSAFVSGGGGLVTEWDGAAMLFNGYDSTYRFSPSNPQAGYFSGEIGSGFFLATGTPINQQQNHPVWDGLPASFSAGGGTEYFYTTYGFDTSEIDVIATFQGNGSANFPNQAFPAVFAGTSLNIVGIPFDFQDNPNNPNLVTLYTNAVEWSATNAFMTGVPEPSSLALWSIGAVGACVFARRRFKRRA